MRLSRVRVVSVLIVMIGLIAAAFPVWPWLERSEVVQTRMQRVEHNRGADFSTGELDGRVVLLEDHGAALLTLDAPGEGIYTSSRLELGIPASSLAASWTQSAGEEGEISLAARTSSDGQTWTQWRKLEGEGSFTSGGRENVFSTPAVVDGARYAQYRITLKASGPILPAIQSVSLFALDSASLPPRVDLRLQLVPRDSALATIKPLGIVSRKQWGANESLRLDAAADDPRGRIWPEEVQSVDKIVVHHTAGPNVCDSADTYCQWRSIVAINDIYYYHAVGLGWGDIGYNSLVGYDGRIYEGRAGPEPETGSEALDQPVVAGHALGYNKRTHGIALMGNFEHESVPDRQYEALAKMVGWIVKSRLASGGIVDPLGFSGYTLSDGQVNPALPNIIGHRDVNDTECPGDSLYDRIVDLRYRAKRLVEWPPVQVELRAWTEGDTVSYHILVDNHEPELIRRLTIKGAVPPNVEFVDSWAGSPGRNRGTFDGSAVTWVDPEGRLVPGSDRREYVFVVRPRSGVPRSAVQTTAWVEFAEPVRGVAMSEVAGADRPIEVIVDAVVGGRAHWTGEWPVSRNVAGYYGDAYQVRDAGDGTAIYTWEADLLEGGTYEVFAWWTAATDRATDAPYTVYARDGARTVRMSQQEQGARWVSLGEYVFDAGRARVTLSDEANGVVIADAVRFRK